MWRFLCVLMAAIVSGAAAGHCQESRAGAIVITFESSTYRDFRQLLSREAATGTVTVRGSLSLPDEAKDKYPAVVVVHTIGGYRDANEGYVAAELRKSGFATLTYDSFAARGTTGAAMSGSPGYLTAGVADAYAALRRLMSEPAINADRIAILGFSYGGEVAHLTAFGPVRSALNSGQGRFAAHVAFYPGGDFGMVAEPGSYLPYTRSTSSTALREKLRAIEAPARNDLRTLRTADCSSLGAVWDNMVNGRSRSISPVWPMGD
jgi:dienelactone hydrolase